ncbi:MAG: Ig-like domain-containing protein, partial [Gemmatimonadetes bacterium]|nr:Ig-like domain-containing protein [Gemmatimonadota bacterium]
MVNLRRFLACPVLISVFFCLVACGDSGPSGPDPNDSVASVTVTPPQVSVDVASSTQLTATVRNGRGEVMTTQVGWSSSSAAVAGVDASGLVTGVTEGAVTITAAAGGHSGTSAVTVNDPFPPLEPSNVAASPVSNTEIRLTWTDNSNNEDDFRIDRELVGGGAEGPSGSPARSSAEVAIVGANTTSYSDTGLQAGTTYRYWVRACNENGCSDSAAGAEDVSTYLALAIETADLPQGTTGVAYSETLEASGGDGTYTWSLSQGVFPDGLVLAPASGLVSGTPFEGGAFPVTLEVQSGDGQSATKALSVEVVFVFSCSGQVEIPESECDALEAFYNTTNGPGWTDSTDWFATFWPCSWYGVTCLEGSVSGLILTENAVTGPIPPELAALTNLTRLFLRRNALSGEIPTELTSLSKLQRLDFHTNQLTGSIPPQLGNLTDLQSLTFYANDLSGTI